MLKTRVKENKVIFVSAILAGAYFLFACYYYKVFPFGTEYTVLKIDLAQQYAPMMTELYDLLKSGRGIFYSWTSGLGYSFFGNYLNYLASPFTYIIFLFSRENIVNAVSIIILLKSMFIAGCFSYFLKKSYGFSDLRNVISSLLFTFSGWFVAYYWNIMWLDAVFCLPLAVLGIQRIIKDKKPLLYVLTLTYAMFTNYYMAYILCLFFCIYFIYYYICENEIKKDFSTGFVKSNFLKSGIMFALSSVTAALLSAVVLVPVYCILKSSSATGDAFNKGLEFYFGFFSFWAQQFSGNSIIVQTGGQPNVPNAWCGMLTIVLLPVYFLSRSFSKKERICDFVLIAFLVFSLSFNAISYVWHGFHFANGLEDRFAFLYVFVGVTITAKALNNIDKLKKPTVIISAVTAVAFIVVMHLTGSEYAGKAALIISVGFIVVWLAVYLLVNIKKLDRDLIKIIAVVVLCLEMVFSQLEDYDLNYYRDDFDGNYSEITSEYSYIREKDDELFFRVELSNVQNLMSPMVMNYYGISNFSSMTMFNVAKSQCALGLDGNDENEFTYDNQTPIYNCVFGLKYIIDNGKYFKDNEWFVSEEKSGEMTVFKNNYYLPLGYCVDKTATEFSSEKGTNPFYQQNELFKSLCGINGVFDYCEPVSVENDNLTVSIENEDSTYSKKHYTVKVNDAEKAGHIKLTYNLSAERDYYAFIYYYRCENDAKVDISGDELDYLGTRIRMGKKEKTVIPLGSFEEDETLNITLPVSEETQGKPICVCLASFNREKFIEGYNKLKNNTLTLSEFENTHFKGTVTADEDCLLFTSIPYDRGWKITLDGNPVSEKDVIAIDDAYISIPLTKGEHTVEFDYFPQGLKAGVCISALTALCLTVYLTVSRKKKKTKK